MTYRNSDHRNDFRSREERYLDDQRRLERRDPYFAHDEALTSYDEANDDWYEGEYQTDDQAHSPEGVIYDDHMHHAEPSAAEHLPEDSSYAEPDYADHGYDSEKLDPRIDDHRAMPNEGIRIEADDLRDIDQAGAFPNFGKGMARVAAFLCFVVVAVLLFLTMKPDVTAYDIISMQEYEGEQRPDWALDPAQVNECDSLSECFKKELSLAKETSPTLTSVQEIPAVNVVAAEPEILEQPVTEDVFSLPARMRVARQWSNIRQAPGMSGAIVGSIARANEVEVLGKEASWYQIRTLDGRNISGYMHSNTLEQ